MRRELLAITKRQHPHPVPEKPAALWLLPPGCDTIPEKLVHHRTAFLEDEMHDWHWKDGNLYYHGAGGDGRCHVVLLFNTHHCPDCAAGRLLPGKTPNSPWRCEQCGATFRTSGGYDD